VSGTAAPCPLDREVCAIGGISPRRWRGGGEPHRAFYGNQFGLTMPLFSHYGVQLWVPEVGGPIDPDNEAHELVMSVFGGMSKGERNRIKIRVRTAMASQTEFEGRYLGGRPPYGYTLTDLGRHPTPPRQPKANAYTDSHPTRKPPRSSNKSSTCTSPIRHLRHRRSPHPRRHPLPIPQDPGRNRHRDGLAWSKGAESSSPTAAT
jgi:site-specific DNA recombinase